MEQAGFPGRVAMKITGHKTEAIYRRYAIVNEQDLRDALHRMDAHRAADTGRRRAATGEARGAVVPLAGLPRAHPTGQPAKNRRTWGMCEGTARHDGARRT